MDKKKMLESMRRRLEEEKEKRFKLFLRLRNYLPEIIRSGKEFNVEKIVLFGSITDKERFTEHSDIDIGITGVKAEDFFKLYSRLSEGIDWAIDLIDLDEDPGFRSMILKKGEIIYDRRSDKNKNLNI